MITGFVRSRGGLWRVSVTLSIVVILMSTVPVAIHQVPLRDEVGAHVFLNATLVVGACLTFHLTSPWPDLEEALPGRRLSGMRAMWFVVLCICVTAAGCLALILRGLADWYIYAYIRNALLAMGIGALSACFLARHSAWLPVTLYGMVSWLWGTIDSEGTARFWSLANQPLVSAGTLAVAALVWALGGVLYIRRDAKGVD